MKVISATVTLFFTYKAAFITFKYMDICQSLNKVPVSVNNLTNGG